MLSSKFGRGGKFSTCCICIHSTYPPAIANFLRMVHKFQLMAEIDNFEIIGKAVSDPAYFCVKKIRLNLTRKLNFLI